MNQQKLEITLKAIANRRRLQILRLLSRKKEMTVTDIAETINLSVAATSKHMILLNKSGITEWVRKSKYVFYKIARDCPKFVFTIIRQSNIRAND